MKKEVKKVEKMKYCSPSLTVNCLVMEYSIAAGSATVNTNEPNITDWTDQGTVGDGVSEF